MLNLGLALISLLILLKSANTFVNQSIALAKKFRISSFLIGFTVMAFGTSLPELVVSTYSTVVGHPTLAIANVIGSNIANLCLILGILAIFRAYKLSKQDVHLNIPINLIGLIIFVLLMIANRWQMNWLLGSVLLLIFPGFIWLAGHDNRSITIKGQTNFSPVRLAFSFVLLTISGKICIDYLLLFAQEFFVADSVLGYFLLAIGTSLPEFITSLIAVKKGNGELAIGNLLGSNLFNLFFILGLNSFITDLNFQAFHQEIFFLLLTTSAVLLLALIGKKYYFSQKEGWGLIGLYLFFVLLQSWPRLAL